MATAEHIKEALPQTAVSLYKSFRRWLVNRRVIADARAEYLEAERVAARVPCQATLDDLEVARKAYEYVRRN